MKGGRGWLVLLLGLGLVRGLIYLSVVPPWQHYDEPIHFERLFWLAELKFRLTPSKASLSLPAEISGSMCESYFWDDAPCGMLPLSRESSPTLEALAIPSQPVYYYLSTPLQLLLRHAPVEIKLYAGRLVSVALYLLTLTVAYFLLRDLFPGDREIGLAVPALIALLPAFIEETSALNNDAGAVAVFSLLLWGIVRLMRDGGSLRSLAWAVGVAVLAVFTKRTAAVGLVVVLVAVLLGCRRLKWWAWMVVGIFALGLIVSAFDWSGSASWYELPSPAPEAIRISSDGPVGQQAMCVGKERYLVQELAPAQVEALRGQTVTVGGWVRTLSSAEGVVSFPSYEHDGAVHTHAVTATSKWQFHIMTATVESEANTLCVKLVAGENGEMVCYDGVAMVQGEFPLGEPPQFESSAGERGVWGGRSFVNTLSNGSGERGWPRVQPWASGPISRLGLLRGMDPTLFVQSILDWQRTRFIYWLVLNRLFESFWARFGWNHLGLERGCYQVLLVPTVLGLGGAVVFGVRRLALARDFQAWQRRALAVLALAAVMAWGIAALFYTHPVLSILPRRPLPVARYAYTAIVPTVLFLFLGWRELVPSRWKRFLPTVSVLGLAWLEVVSLMGAILPYYYLR
jgi:hypothetical protein